MSELVCPKCGADMRQYERNGVTVDQCTGCRGLFLDRGELEKLVEAESSYYAPPQPQVQQQQYQQPYVQHPQHYGYKKKKRSFLEELFD